MKNLSKQYVTFLVCSLSLFAFAAPSFAEDRLESAVANHVQQEHKADKASGALKPQAKATAPATSRERKSAAAPSGARLASNTAVARSNLTSMKSNHEAQHKVAKKHPEIHHKRK